MADRQRTVSFYPNHLLTGLVYIEILRHINIIIAGIADYCWHRELFADIVGYCCHYGLLLAPWVIVGITRYCWHRELLIRGGHCR